MRDSPAFATPSVIDWLHSENVQNKIKHTTRYLVRQYTRGEVLVSPDDPDLEDAMQIAASELANREKPFQTEQQFVKWMAVGTTWRLITIKNQNIKHPTISLSRHKMLGLDIGQVQTFEPVDYRDPEVEQKLNARWKAICVGLSRLRDEDRKLLVTLFFSHNWATNRCRLFWKGYGTQVFNKRTQLSRMCSTHSSGLSKLSSRRENVL